MNASRGRIETDASPWRARVQSARRRNRALTAASISESLVLPIAQRDPIPEEARNVTDLLASMTRACAALRKTVSVRKLCASTAGARGSRETAADLRLGREVWIQVLKGGSVTAEQRADLVALAEEGVRPVESFAWEILRVLLGGRNPRTFYARLRLTARRDVPDAEPQRSRVAARLDTAGAGGLTRAPTCASDHSWIVVGGQRYDLHTSLQREIMRVLWSAWEKGGCVDGCGLSTAAIHEELGRPCERLRVKRVFERTGLLGGVLRRSGRDLWALHLSGLVPSSHKRAPRKPTASPGAAHTTRETRGHGHRNSTRDVGGARASVARADEVAQTRGRRGTHS